MEGPAYFRDKSEAKCHLQCVNNANDTCSEEDEVWYTRNTTLNCFQVTLNFESALSTFHAGRIVVGYLVRVTVVDVFRCRGKVGYKIGNYFKHLKAITLHDLGNRCAAVYTPYQVTGICEYALKNTFIQLLKDS
ncbi:hypothetical protein CBL_00535 [Carabus blaptoides fortunei]